MNHADEHLFQARLLKEVSPGAPGPKLMARMLSVRWHAYPSWGHQKRRSPGAKLWHSVVAINNAEVVCQSHEHSLATVLVICTPICPRGRSVGANEQAGRWLLQSLGRQLLAVATVRSGREATNGGSSADISRQPFQPRGSDAVYPGMLSIS